MQGLGSNPETTKKKKRHFGAFAETPFHPISMVTT